MNQKKKLDLTKDKSIDNKNHSYIICTWEFCTRIKLGPLGVCGARV
jgi:hypothetical protein